MITVLAFIRRPVTLGMCILLPILIGVLLASCGTHTLAVSPLELVVSGDTDGWITPCGCTANQSGGLLRRGTYLRQQREHATVLYADVGGAPAGVSAYQQTLFESILKGEQQMNICAHNIGGPEAAFGSAYLRHLQSLMRVPLISANLRDADGAEVAPPLVIVAAGGRRIAFVGIVSPRYAQPGIRILEPLATVRALVAERKSEFDTLIILAYLPDEDLQRFAADLPEADAVIGGPTGQSIPPKVIGPTLLASATRKGKFLVHLDIPPRDAGLWKGDIVELASVYADDPSQHQNVVNYLENLRLQDFSSTTTGLEPLLAGHETLRIAGSDSCTTCHKPDADVWHQSHHAHAWPTLVAKHYEVDPSCQQCHTTGYGLPGGFASAKRGSNVDVGCEDCHGPSQSHVADPKNHTLYRAADQCVRCHDAENSPTFQYETFYPKIAHGKHPATDPAGGG